MSKNTTRKGLALGAVSALVISGFAAAPANAAGLADTSFVSLAPSTGTAYGTLVDLTFSLTSNEASSVSANGRNLKFLVENAAGDIEAMYGTTGIQATNGVDDNDVVALNTTTDVVTITNADLAAELTSGERVYFGSAIHADDGSGAADADILSANTAVTVTVSGNNVSFTTDVDLSALANVGTIDAIDGATIRPYVIAEAKNATTKAFVVNTGVASANSDEILKIAAPGATTTKSAQVTAWVDANGNDVIDSTEYASPVRTVTFYANADLTVTTTISGPVLGATGATATVAISPELNGQQVGNASTEVTTTWTLQSSTVNTNTATYNTTTKVWDVAMDLNGNDVIVVGSYSVRASVNATAIGNTSTGAVSARVAADTDATVSASNDTTYVYDDDASDNIQVSTVRATKSATVTMAAYDSDGDAIGAGRAVTVYFANATTTTDWTVNGVKVLDNAASASKTYTTNASGELVLTVSSTAGAAADTIDIEFSPENVGSQGNAANAEVRLTWATASYAIVDLNAPVNGATRNIVTGGTVTVDMFVGDQWNAPLTGDYRVYMSASGRTSNGQNVTITNGRASYTVTDAALGSGSTITIATQLQKLTSGTWGDSSAATDLSDITVNVAAAPLTSVVLSTITDGAGGDNDGVAPDLTVKQIAEYNAETSQGDFVNPSASLEDAYFTITSGVSAGDIVTVSGTGLYFGYYDASATTVLRVAKDSMTFVLDNTSDRIYVYSNVYAKAKPVTVTSKGRSATINITTDTAVATSGKTWTVSMPASANPGSTFKVTATLTDAFGNPVRVSTAGDVAVKYDGPGIVFGTLPNTTDTSGQLSFAVLLGSNDKGTATVTFSYDQGSDDDFTGTAAGDLDVVTAKTLTVGTGSSGAGKVNVGSFNGKLVVYASGLNGARISWKVGGNWGSQVAASNYAIFNRPTPRAGVTVSVDIYVNGVKTLTKSVVTR